MKKKLLVLLLLIIAFITFLGIKFFILDNQSDSGILKVLSSPNASIFLNNEAIGKTPFEDRIKEGEYLVKLIPEGNATDTASWQGKINVFRNTLAFIDRELGNSELSSSGVVFTVVKIASKPFSSTEGEISVESEPEGSIVYLDNDEKGMTPLLLTRIEKGDHELSVSAPGFFRRTQKINVEANYRINTTFKLAIDPAFKAVEEKDLQDATASATPTQSESTDKTSSSKNIIIADTPTGWLRVRTEPNLNASEAAKVKPGDKFTVIEEQAGWYKIRYLGRNEGWISATYTKVQ
ncbi:hypothetical protein A3C23_05300 [Candidatus Roizmanbacteria bacterium RIFCSPHIGHO2_02_FULL_37_13b]|uniref:SH3b domain-containing protein n=1 Tax=Candidatus Roizmanbacteria bacterium RIFCSPLOWO2_02_FULL_36_11 TaxID=1802071 RepID=A0A1F7JCK5_9BACT|nr:MAG: hypothetical protein A3C23_05300 [Candidatus Roizmanbacteria bacterium RIFCSPHIGHO2_02_FULL_37_13b]OGK53340.1 MAG: hypothetical protein A3H78_03490 [Candidatus Roizmanbacteria bacterium RIFCSPLOWO2_02_FULL_36_11]